MDTRFWGPPGWRLLHLISFSPQSQGEYESLRAWFELMEYVLPCKFCRRSYSEYIAADPFPEKAADVPRWLWRIHNQVNKKLRSQNLPTAPDPPFSAVKKVYEERLAAGCTKTEFEGWEFLFSVAENHPFSRGGRSTVPFEGAPEGEARAALTPPEQNRWNILPPEERIRYYVRWWRLLPAVMPYMEWSDRVVRGPYLMTQSRASLIRSLWKLRCFMEKELDLLNKTEFKQLCSRLAGARSGCGRATGAARTCRRHPKKKHRNSNKTRRNI
jgi:Erv1 / Alr family